MRFALLFCSSVLLAAPLLAEVKVSWERNDDSSASRVFSFQKIGRPQKNDAAKSGTFTVLKGSTQQGSGGIAVLNDGRVPASEDAPESNFFFAHGTKGGRILLDLGKVTPIKEVRSFSWHNAERGPQVYKLYAADQAPVDLKAAAAGDPESLGWRHLASVDTRTNGASGGQYAVSIQESGGKFGDFRYLVFDIGITEDNDPFGNTFYSEIDVIAAGSNDEPVDNTKPEVITRTFESGPYRYTIDATLAPDLLDWSEAKLMPVVKEWYPKLVEMLKSDGYEAPKSFTLRYRDDMRGTPASAGGSRINLNIDWFRKSPGEAVGAVVHEMAHIVQNYGWGRRRNPNATRTPGWIVEGIPDYIRWFLYEPEKKGAEITSRNLARAKYDASYRVTGNFLDWVARKYGQNVIWKLNAAAREGKYSPDLWKELTGQSVEELGKTWHDEHEQRLKAKAGQ
jgi:hypothetical protein